MSNLRPRKLFCLALTLALYPSLFTSATADIGESREDPLIVALQKYEPKLWSAGTAEILAGINRERTCTLIEFLAKDVNGNPDIQLDGQGNLITRDKYGKKLAELRKVSADRLKQDLGIVVAAPRQGELNPETRKQLNVALYGPEYEKGPRNDADRSRAAQRLRDAVLELGQYRDAKKVEKLQARQQSQRGAQTISAISTPEEKAKSGVRRADERDDGQSLKANATQGMAKRTREAWDEYHAMQIPAGEYWQQFVFQRNALRQLNLQNVDPDLVTYYRLLEQQLTEEIPVIKAWETEEAKEDWGARNAANREAECQRAYELHQPCERDAGDALSVLQDFMKFSGRSSGAGGTAEQRWKPTYDRIEAKYNPAMAASIKRVELKYGFDCYSSVFDKRANDIFRAGLDYVEKEKWADAVGPLKEALRMNPNHLWAHLRLGFCYYALKQYELAMGEFREQLRLNPNRADPQFGMGLCFWQLNRYSEAIGPLQEAIRLKSGDPEYNDAYYYLGTAYLLTGNRSAALAQYRILQRIDANAAADLYREISKQK